MAKELLFGKAAEKRGDWVSIQWHINDIKGIAEDLSDDECRQVLALAIRRHDCCIGLSWDVLGYHVEDVRGQRNALPKLK